MKDELAARQAIWELVGFGIESSNGSQNSEVAINHHHQSWRD
jgi:hypothetical protein